MRLLWGRRVWPDREEVVKFGPDHPPVRGEIVMVDGQRSRVTHARVHWLGRRWTILALWVKPAP